MVLSLVYNSTNKRVKEGVKNGLLYLRQSPALRVLAGAAGLFFLVFTIYSIVFWGRIFPGIYVANVYVGGKTPSEAHTLLIEHVSVPEKIILVSSEQTYEIDLKTLGFKYNFDQSVQTAYNLYRTGNTPLDVFNQIIALFRPSNLGLRFDLDRNILQKNLSVIAGEVSTEPIYPSIRIKAEEIFIEKGKPGQELDTETLIITVGKNLAFANKDAVHLPMRKVDPSLTDEEVVLLKERARKFLGKSLSFAFEDRSFTYDQESLLNLLEPKGGYKEEKIVSLIEEIAASIEREAQDPVFVFSEGRVKEFSPAKDGIKVNKPSLKEKFVRALEDLEAGKTYLVVDIPYKTTPPSIQTSEVNNLGIKELLGKGISYFRGSISPRVHNIALAASKFNGVLIPPGETLSFNNVLGDVSSYTGYKQAYVIKDGKTILGDGGGVCQVSTTLFRAALDAGLPIIERKAHSYRVSYYEQGFPPGLDATVYAPMVDLKIKNDTPAYLLIQTKIDKKNSALIFEIYGSPDGRVATITRPKIFSQTPPPEDLYIDDPTLPQGTIKQIDWKAWGAKVSFNYIVKKGDEVVFEKTFYSNYKPWQAVFLKGTKAN